MMWNDLLSALCLVMVFEGLMPFISPRRAKKMMVMMSQLNDKSLRISGLLSMLSGVLLLAFLR
ncbi:MAG: DUF2065 domain-containing protein [Immundisolibacteraceae bacterium]|nr:DUF2065 domain-containing protein [Immundisolibacteraceae bacterium]